MKRWVVNWKFWSLLGIGIIIAVLVPVLADREEGTLTATPYADVIRFEAESAATLQVRIFDLSGKELWDSGVVSGQIVDWDRRNEWGERLAYGAYLYTAQGWAAQGDLVLQKKGKLALLPGDKVQLQVAPSGLHPRKVATPESNDAQVRPMAGGTACSCNEFSGTNKDVYVEGKVGIGTTGPGAKLHIADNGTGVKLTRGTLTTQWFGAENGPAYFGTESDDDLILRANARNIGVIKNNGNVGIGTINPSATLEVHGNESDLLALYDPALPGDAKFRVEKDGDVYADGTYYCSDGQFHTGYADMAERINTSEWVEPGNVVEIDPEHPGFFRKSSSPYSTKVAGIISTSPGVILGNSFNEATDDWEDNRPVLAIAGRVPLQVTTENGPIRIGDLLVSSSIPGYAMRCSDPQKAMGTVVGKAMEPLEEGIGVIVVQAMLR